MGGESSYTELLTFWKWRAMYDSLAAELIARPRRLSRYHRHRCGHRQPTRGAIVCNGPGRHRPILKP